MRRPSKGWSARSAVCPALAGRFAFAGDRRIADDAVAEAVAKALRLVRNSV